MTLFLAMIVFTLIKDFAVNKDALKKQGIKGVFTEVVGSVTKDFTETAGRINVPNGISDMVSVSCPSCVASVIKGKKFCNKCGQRMPGAQPKATSSRDSQAVSKSMDKVAPMPISKSSASAKPARDKL